MALPKFRLKIAFAAAECVPYVKTGGLADVAGALPKALAELGCAVKLFLPLYGSIPVFEYDLQYATELQGVPVDLGGRTVRFNTWYGRLPGSPVEVYLVDCPHYFHRAVPYTQDADEHERFVLFQHAVFKILQRYHWAPDVLHANDWQTGLLPALLRRTYDWDALFARTASLFTIHNIGYQGRFDASHVAAAGLPAADYYPGGPLEFYGSFCFLKAGIAYADAVSTVSETYAREIQTPRHGHGLDGLLRSRAADLYGIVNGIDTDAWNPAEDDHLPARYDRNDLGGKAANKRALLDEMGLPYDPDVPVVGIVSRLVSQKGFHLLEPTLERLLAERDVQFVVLGSGEPRLEVFFERLRADHPERVGVRIGYDERLSHRIEAGADLFLMPSAYEPCGLNQMYSLNYGTVPVVHHTGGLADVVRDYHRHNGRGNGFSFAGHDRDALHATLHRALDVYADRDAWDALRRRGMHEDFSWDASARKYLALYEDLAARRR